MFVALYFISKTQSHVNCHNGLQVVSGSYKAKLTQFRSFLSLIKGDALNTLQVRELIFRLTTIEEMYSEYDSTQFNIENLSEIPEKQYQERETYENQYHAAIASAQELLRKHETSVSGESVAGSGTGSGHKGGIKLKLPTIHLPTFSGQYHNWLEFRDTLTLLIHSNDSILRISKFHYLCAALKDSSALIICTLDFAEENYDVAWELLSNRYKNKRLLVYNHIQAFFNIEIVTKESFKALRNMIDTINRNLRALKTLNPSRVREHCLKPAYNVGAFCRYKII